MSSEEPTVQDPSPQPLRQAYAWVWLHLPTPIASRVAPLVARLGCRVHGHLRYVRLDGVVVCFFCHRGCMLEPGVDVWFEEMLPRFREWRQDLYGR